MYNHNANKCNISTHYKKTALYANIRRSVVYMYYTNCIETYSMKYKKE